MHYDRCNLPYCPFFYRPLFMQTRLSKSPLLTKSVLAWPAWLRLLAVLPALLLLWLAVLWASAEAVPL